MPADYTGQEVLGYRIVSLLGEGGMASVWRAESADLGAAVAIKILDPELARDPGTVQRFTDKARIQFNLVHPNIVRVIHMGRNPPAMVMDLIEGRSLSDIIGAEVGPMPIARAQPMMHAIMEAVAHAHDQGVIHRDIKPSNVLVTPNDQVRVMDFGIAKVLGGNSRTRTGVTMGTLAYMAPEQIEDAKDADARADVYALGTTFYEMLAGRTPFEQDTSEFKLMNAQVNQAPPDPRRFYPGVPDWTVPLLMRSLQKAPGDRFQTVQEMQQVWRVHAPGQAAAPGPAATVTPGAERPPAVAAATAVEPTTRAVHEARGKSPLFLGVGVILGAMLLLFLGLGGGYLLATTTPEPIRVEDGADVLDGDAREPMLDEPKAARDIGAPDLLNDPGFEDEDCVGPHRKICGQGKRRACVNLRTNRWHCGKCNRVCKPSTRCVRGRCKVNGVAAKKACRPPMLKCWKDCVDPRWNPRHCGKCGISCKGRACKKGKCTGQLCKGSSTRCSDNRCVHLLTDPFNCGKCGNECPERVCTNGKCGVGAPSDAKKKCPGKTKRCGKECVDIKVDPNNCGMCGFKCHVGKCVNGKCKLEKCAPGFTKCGNKCVMLAMDPRHCGKCNNICKAGEQCILSKCMKKKPACPERQTKCGEHCTDLRVDINNCGKCGKACDTRRERCIRGRCIRIR